MLYRIARILQERAREFAVAESLNGGKPIRESRDVDLPLAAAQLVQQANDNGGRDNVSVILVRVLKDFSARTGLVDRLKSWFK